MTALSATERAAVLERCLRVVQNRYVERQIVAAQTGHAIQAAKDALGTGSWHTGRGSTEQHVCYSSRGIEVLCWAGRVVDVRISHREVVAYARRDRGVRQLALLLEAS